MIKHQGAATDAQVMFLYLVGGAMGSAAFLLQEYRQLPGTQCIMCSESVRFLSLCKADLSLWEVFPPYQTLAL